MENFSHNIALFCLVQTKNILLIEAKKSYNFIFIINLITHISAVFNHIKEVHYIIFRMKKVEINKNQYEHNLLIKKRVSRYQNGFSFIN